MSSLPDRPKPINEIAIEKKYPKRNPHVDSSKRISETWLVSTFKKILILCFCLLAGILIIMIIDARTSYQYRIAVNGNHYQCNIIERGNPTYLKDCWQGNSIVIYDPINLVVVE